MVAKVRATMGLGAAAGTNGDGKPATVATDIDCDECGKPMIVRTGRRGRFLGCSGYPKCKNTAELPAKLVEDLGLNSSNGSRAVNGNGHPAAAGAPAQARERR